MRTLVTADLHLSANARDRYRVDTMHELYRVAKDKGVGQTLLLGDLTEEKDRHSDWLTNQVVEVVRSFAKLGLVYILQGNHDSYSNPDCPFFHFLRHMPQVRWIGRAKSIVLPGIGRTLWLPHARNYKKEWGEYGNGDVPLSSYAFIFAHCMFVGTELGNGRQADGGVPLKTIPSGARCIAGDVHIPQRLGSVEYVGAPYTVDFGDEYKPRAILLDGDRQSNIRLDHLPQKRLIELDGSKGELDRLDGLNEGDILKVRIAMPRHNAHLWPEQRDKLRAHYTKQGYVVHAIIPKVIEDLGKRVRISSKAEAKSDAQVFAEFAVHRGLDKGTRKRGEKLL